MDITKNNFENEVLNSDLPVLIDFWATWCGPCKMIAPIVEELSDELEGKLKVGKVNVDSEGDLAMKFGIMSIPTIMIIKEGKVLETLVGYRTKAQLLSTLADLGIL